jgi:hypothetical protein
MTTRLPTVVATLSIAGLLAWMASVSRQEPAAPSVSFETTEEPRFQERSGGSEVLCAVPLAWRIARVDPEFDVTAEEATAIVREAAELWEDGTGLSLFTHDSDGGFPIRLVYDERQELLMERVRRERELEESGARLTAEQAASTARGERHATDVTNYQERVDDLEGRVAEHNATVRRWNEQGGVSALRGAEIAAVSDALRDAQQELTDESRALDGALASIRGEEEELNERILANQRLSEELAAAFPPSSVEAGEYREAVRRVDDLVDSVSREIRLYRFASDAELRLISAHEFGHALGLGHTEDPSGVMNASADGDQPVTGLATTDVALLREVCPAG